MEKILTKKELKEIEKEFNSLEILPYEKMVEILNKEKHTLIWFTKYKDVLITGNEYHYVQVRDINNDIHTTYRAPDQNEELIEENLFKAIEMSPIEGKYSYFESDWAIEFFYKIGDNAINFPTSIARRMIEEYHKSSKIESEFKLTSKRKAEFDKITKENISREQREKEKAEQTAFGLTFEEFSKRYDDNNGFDVRYPGDSLSAKTSNKKLVKKMDNIYPTKNQCESKD